MNLETPGLLRSNTPRNDEEKSVIASGAKQSSLIFLNSSSPMRAQPAIGDLMPVFERSPTLREAQVEEGEKGIFRNGVIEGNIK